MYLQDQVNFWRSYTVVENNFQDPKQEKMSSPYHLIHIPSHSIPIPLHSYATSFLHHFIPVLPHSYTPSFLCYLIPIQLTAFRAVSNPIIILLKAQSIDFCAVAWTWYWQSLQWATASLNACSASWNYRKKKFSNRGTSIKVINST